MIERDPFADSDRDAVHESFDLRETLAHWSEPAEDEPTEEEKLAQFLAALSRSDRSSHNMVEGIPTNPVGRRSAPRLRVSLPARFIAVEETHKAILLNISRTGAQIAIIDAVREGEGGILECAGLKVFAIVARSEFSLNALHFEEELTDEQVLDIRRYYENFEERERRALIETAKKWVNGDAQDDRAL